jgi:hypothetical protein
MPAEVNRLSGALEKDRPPVTYGIRDTSARYRYKFCRYMPFISRRLVSNLHVVQRDSGATFSNSRAMTPDGERYARDRQQQA